MVTKFASMLLTAGLAVRTAAFTPAFSDPTESGKNSSFLSGWRTLQGQGTLNQGVTLVSNGTSTHVNSTYYGVVQHFNETLASNQTTTPVPWIAFVSCDASPSTEATLALPFAANGTVATNSTVDGNSTASSANSTSSDLGNSTTPDSTLNGVNTTYLPNLFTLAANLGASSVLLYSEKAQSCQLNYTADAAFNRSIPVFSSPSQDVTNLIISSQFGNIEAAYRYFNSTLLSDAAVNLTAIISGTISSSIPTQFVIGKLTASYNKNDSSNGVVATIGRAPTSTKTSQGSASTSDPSTPSSDAQIARRSGFGFLIASLVFTGLVALA